MLTTGRSAERSSFAREKLTIYHEEPPAEGPLACARDTRRRSGLTGLCCRRWMARADVALDGPSRGLDRYDPGHSISHPLRIPGESQGLCRDAHDRASGGAVWFSTLKDIHLPRGTTGGRGPGLRQGYGEGRGWLKAGAVSLPRHDASVNGFSPCSCRHSAGPGCRLVPDGRRSLRWRRAASNTRRSWRWPRAW